MAAAPVQSLAWEFLHATSVGTEVHIGDTQAQVLTWTAWGLEVVLPPLPTGLHGISVSINRVRIGAQG